MKWYINHVGPAAFVLAVLSLACSLAAIATGTLGIMIPGMVLGVLALIVKRN